MTRLLLAVVVLVALVGCGTPTAAPADSGPVIGETIGQGVIPAPSAISIPRLDIYSDLVPTGILPDGTAEVPPLDQPLQASWLEPGVIPGQPGPAVLYGHVSGRQDGVSVPGVFARLAELETDDQIVVERYGAPALTWRVTRVERYGKTEFPTEVVYGDTDGPELRAVTCGGTYDPAARSFEDNVVAYAVLAA